MNLEETLAFVSVVEAGSFTAAARRLDAPKSTLSRQVSRLEDALGSRLLHRTTRRLTLTDVGRAYYERCKAGLTEIEEAQRLAQDVSGTPRGRLRVACPFDFARDYLASALVPFRELYPEITVELRLGQGRADLVGDQFDVALRGGKLEDSSMVARKLAHSRIYLVASPEYLDANGRPATFEDLAQHEVVMMPFPGNVIPMFTGPRGVVDQPLNPWLVVNEWGVLRSVVLRGGGIGPNLQDNVTQDLEAGRLERVLPDHLTDGGGLYAVYPSRHHLSPKVRVFVDFLDARLRAHPVAAVPR